MIADPPLQVNISDDMSRDNTGGVNTVFVMANQDEFAALAIRRRMRERDNMSQPVLARLVGRAQSWVSTKLLGEPDKTVRHLLYKEPEVFEKLVSALGWTPEEFAAETTLDLPGLTSLNPEPKRKRPLPAELQTMIDEKGKLDPDLHTERWQQYLAQQRFATGSATPERWWNLFLLLKNAGVEPGGN